jgi:hypothetical protein
MANKSFTFSSSYSSQWNGVVGPIRDEELSFKENLEVSAKSMNELFLNRN